MPEKRINVLCVDDSPQMTTLIDRVVREEPDLVSLGALDRADELVEKVERLKPNVILLDLSMPGRDALDALRDLTDRCPTSRVIVFSGRSDPHLVDEALKRGAWGFVMKDAGLDRILSAIRAVAQGKRVGKVSYPHRAPR